jgi:Zn-dependent M28 family amino/carboxypeptidase
MSDFSKVKLLLNLDLMCGGDDGIMVVNATSERTKDFYNLLVTKNGEENWVAQVKSRANAANSDHFPFTMVGVPAVFV